MSDTRFVGDVIALHDSPIARTERAAEDSAIRFLLDGLGVPSIQALKDLVDFGTEARPILAAVAIYGEGVNLPAIVAKVRALLDYEPTDFQRRVLGDAPPQTVSEARDRRYLEP